MQIKFEIKPAHHEVRTSYNVDTTSFEGGWAYINFTPEELMKIITESSTQLDAILKFLETLGLKELMLKKLTKVN